MTQPHIKRLHQLNDLVNKKYALFAFILRFIFNDSLFKWSIDSIFKKCLLFATNLCIVPQKSNTLFCTGLSFKQCSPIYGFS